MKRVPNFYVYAAFAVVVVALGCTQQALQETQNTQTSETRGANEPAFQVDPFWPKELPNKWLLGTVIGMHVDSRDHIWVIHRPG